MSDLIAIDTETGGLIAGESALLSLSIVPSWDYQPLTLYFEPIGQIDDGARKVNGYTPESWAAKGAMPLKHGLIAAQYWLEQSGAKKRKARPLAHNAAFDNAFVSAAERMTGIELGLPRRWRCSMVTMLAAIDAGHVSALAPASLDSLGELSGYWEQSPRSAAHDATQDARCCLHGYQWLIQKLTNQESTAVETAAAGAGIDLAAALESRKKEARRMSTLFPNGSAFMDWFARNCERCKRDGACYLKTDCPEFEAKPSISPDHGIPE